MNFKVILGFVLISMMNPFFCSAKNIQSPRVTDWGKWGTWEYCDDGKVAIGMSLQTEKVEPGIDNTALNGVALLCGKRGSSGGSWIYSKRGKWGDWGTDYKCPTGKYITGFQLRSLSPLGGGDGWSKDDTAAENLRIFCGHDGEFLDGDGINGRSSWSFPQRCPRPQGVCGLRTQVEEPQGSGDDTALNNVEMYCCPVTTR